MIHKYAEIFCWKNVSSFCSAKATHIFSAKNIRILCIESAKTVNEMTLNELVKLTTLWTTGPRSAVHSAFWWGLDCLLTETLNTVEHMDMAMIGLPFHCNAVSLLFPYAQKTSPLPSSFELHCVCTFARLKTKQKTNYVIQWMWETYCFPFRSGAHSH